MLQYQSLEYQSFICNITCVKDDIQGFDIILYCIYIYINDKFQEMKVLSERMIYV